MNKKISIAGLSLLLMMGITQPAWAETVMEKVARTGILTVGTRIDIVPYSYIDSQGELVGYSVDVVKLIRDQIQQELGKPITIQVVVEEDFPQRMTHLASEAIDLACDTAFTWQRDQFVDFSVSYGVSGIRLLVKNGSSLGTPESLRGKRIGVLPNTVAEPTIRAIQPSATIVPLDDVASSMAALQRGEVDAIAGDTIILAGEAARNNPSNFALVPVEPYARYGIACMVPENNSSFLDLVNYSLVRMMQGYVNGNTTLVDRWFGPQGVVELPPELLRTFFQGVILSREQVPLTSPSPAATPATGALQPTR